MQLTATETAIAKAGTIKEQVCKILHWSELEYANYQYEQGLAYLHAYIPRDPLGIQELESSRIFWNWWKNQWVIRDETFLQTNCYNARSAHHVYFFYHNANELAKELHPRAVVLGKSYASMIGDFIKSIL